MRRNTVMGNVWANGDQSEFEFFTKIASKYNITDTANNEHLNGDDWGDEGHILESHEMRLAESVDLKLP